MVEAKSDNELITEAEENAERDEQKRLDAEMDKTTEMFRDYLKSHENSPLALDEIDKALNRFHQGTPKDTRFLARDSYNLYRV